MCEFSDMYFHWMQIELNIKHSPLNNVMLHTRIMFIDMTYLGQGKIWDKTKYLHNQKLRLVRPTNAETYVWHKRNKFSSFKNLHLQYI